MTPPRRSIAGRRKDSRHVPKPSFRNRLRALRWPWRSPRPAVSANGPDWSPGPAPWAGDLTPITAADWNYDRAAHLLSRAGFGGTPEDIRKLADMTPAQAVRSLVEYDGIPNDHLEPFEHSGLWDETLVNFPPSRPAATELAEKRGEGMGVQVKPEHVNRHMQPVSDRFFYWLRATLLETRRVGYWWAERMLDTHRPLEEKMALFWHGHFATPKARCATTARCCCRSTCSSGTRRATSGPAGGGGAGPGDALLPGRGREREGRGERELRARGDGVVHDGGGQLLGAGRAGGGAGVHGLELREPGLRGAPGAARRRGEDVPGARGELRRRGGARHHPGAGGDGGVHRGEGVPLLRAGGPVAGAGVGAGRGVAGQRLRAASAAGDDVPVARLLQRGELRGAHQGSGGARGDAAQAPGRGGRAGGSRLQPDDHGAGPAPAEPAVGGGLGAGQVVDHAGAHPGARQRRLRLPVSRPSQLRGAEQPVRQLRRGGRPAAPRLRRAVGDRAGRPRA